MSALKKSSDLGAVLVAASYLDAALGAILQKKFKKGRTAEKLLAPRGLLGNFSARCDLAYVLQVIPKEFYQELTKILEIRNEFAHHHLELSFSNPRISAMVAELRFLQLLLPHMKSAASLISKTITDSRQRFLLTVVLLSQVLLVLGWNDERTSTSATPSDQGKSRNYDNRH